MTEFFILLNQVLVLFILMGIGYFFVKTGKLTRECSEQLTFVLCYLITPCIIFHSFQQQFNTEKFHNLLVILAAATLIHFFLITASHLIFNGKFIADAEKKSALRFSAVYCNCAFMGFPLLLSIVGIDGLFYGSAYNAIFGLFIWTHGFLLYTRRFDMRSILRALINPNIAAIIGGLLCFSFSLRLPAPLLNSIKFIADLNTGLSMIVIGMLMTRLPFRTLFKDGRVFFCILLRNIIFPFCVVFTAAQISLDHDLFLTIAVLSACPTAGMAVLFATLLQRDTAYPSRLMILSTLFSLVTIPLVVLFAKHLLNA